MKNKKLQRLVEELLKSEVAEPVATEEREPRTLKVKLNNTDVYPKDEHEQKEEVEEVLVEGMRGRPSNKAKRAAPKGVTVVGKDGKLQVIKKLQKVKK